MQNNKTSAVNYLICIVVICLLHGCAFYPHLDASNEIGKSDGKSGVDCYTAKSLDHAKQCAYASLDELDSMLTNLGYTERTFAYTAVAAGTYSGIRIAGNSGNNAPLKYTAIGIASLVGLRAAVDPARQQKVLSAGITAHQCILDAVNAVEYAANIVKTNTEPVYELLGQGEVLTDNLSTKFAGQADLVPVARMLVGYANQSESDFRDATTRAESNLAGELASSIILLRSRVRSLLASYSADIETLHDAQKNRVAGMLKDIAAGGAAAEKDNQKVQQLFNIYGFSTPNTKMIEAAEPAREVISRCVADNLNALDK